MSTNTISHDVTRNLQVSPVPPEIPRRPSTTVQRPTTSMGMVPNVTLPNAGVTNGQEPQPIRRHDRVREIHKNAWLKRLHTSYDKKGAPLIKRVEKWWLVFCVHDDTEAYLEFYSEPKMAQVHKPSYRVSLTTCLHVSPSIVGQDNEFQFAVTLSSQVIYLAAADWDQMLEWVESLQGKLREMNILSPKDNLYSKLPEISSRSCHPNFAFGPISTRDPNSPLPPTPNRREPSTSYIDMTSQFPSNEPSPIVTTVPSRDLLLEVNTPLSTSVYVQPNGSGNVISITGDSNTTCDSAGNGRSILRIDTSVVGTPINPSENSSTVPSLPCPSRTSPVLPPPSNNTTLVQVRFDSSNTSSSVSSSTASSILNTTSPPFDADCMSSLNGCRNEKSGHRFKANTVSTISNNFCSISSSAVDTQSGNSSSLRQSSDSRDISCPRQIQTANDWFYEHIFVPTPAAPYVEPGSESSQHPDIRPAPCVPERNQAAKKKEKKAIRQPPVVIGEIGEPIHFQTNAHAVATTVNRDDNPNPTVVNSILHETNAEINGGRATTIPPPLDPAIGRIVMGYIQPASPLETRSSNSQHLNAVGGGTSSDKSEKALVYVPLKESQVNRLKLEISHTSGVRIALRRKDCLDTIAFVDYLGGVWVAGWKQQEHPVLYYAFHVGDQIISIGGQKIQCGEDARKAIRKATTHQVEFIIRRLPHGKVFVLKRKIEGEPLGLVAVGNCSEISEVVPNSLAAAAGLSPKATSLDGHSACNWVLTEINNRPLSLIARESEVRDRLNAVGKEITILVQPSDLVKHLKKQLKTLRGFKEYLVV